jgi:hypothetical protein
MGKQAERGADRAARLEAVRVQQRRGQRRRTLTWVGATGGVVVILVGAVIWAVLASRPKATSQSLAGVVTYSELARDHVVGKVTYAQTPPVGGKHSAVWQNCGIYSAPVANENAVHSMEHGAVWITYQPNLAGDAVVILRDDVRGQPYGLLTPYPGLPTPVVATVWGTQLKLQSAMDPRLKAFIAKYADATKAPEPRGECTGGIGTPQS